MLYTAATHDGPAAVRYPRGQGPGATVVEEMTALPIGKAEVLREGRSGLALVAVGVMLEQARALAEEFDATVVNLRFVKPLDTGLLLDVARRHRAVVTLEDNAVAGGAGEAVLECLRRHSVAVPSLALGIPDRFIEHGSRDENLADAGLDLESLRGAVARFWSRGAAPRAVPAGG